MRVIGTFMPYGTTELSVVLAFFPILGRGKSLNCRWLVRHCMYVELVENSHGTEICTILALEDTVGSTSDKWNWKTQLHHLQQKRGYSSLLYRHARTTFGKVSFHGTFVRIKRFWKKKYLERFNQLTCPFNWCCWLLQIACWITTSNYSSKQFVSQASCRQARSSCW